MVSAGDRAVTDPASTRSRQHTYSEEVTMTAVAHGWEIVSRHKIVDTIVVLLAAAALAVILVLTLGNASAGGSSGSGSGHVAGVGPRVPAGPDCHWAGHPTAC
jgi:hypothetical protein